MPTGFILLGNALLLPAGRLQNDIFCTMESIMIQEMHEIMHGADNMVLMTCDEY